MIKLSPEAFFGRLCFHSASVGIGDGKHRCADCGHVFRPSNPFLLPKKDPMTTPNEASEEAKPSDYCRTPSCVLERGHGGTCVVDGPRAALAAASQIATLEARLKEAEEKRDTATRATTQLVERLAEVTKERDVANQIATTAGTQACDAQSRLAEAERRVKATVDAFDVLYDAAENVYFAMPKCPVNEPVGCAGLACRLARALGEGVAALGPDAKETE